MFTFTIVSIVLPDFEIIKFVYFFLSLVLFDCKLSINSKFFFTLSKKTRDKKIRVLKDQKSKIIFLEKYTLNNKSY